jgi:hypothetical protein
MLHADASHSEDAAGSGMRVSFIQRQSTQLVQFTGVRAIDADVKGLGTTNGWGPAIVAYDCSIVRLFVRCVSFCILLPLLLQDYLSQYRDLLGISVISVVNAAICDYHVRNCPPSPQLTQVCDEVSISNKVAGSVQSLGSYGTTAV